MAIFPAIHQLAVNEEKYHPKHGKQRPVLQQIWIKTRVFIEKTKQAKTPALRRCDRDDCVPVLSVKKADFFTSPSEQKEKNADYKAAGYDVRIIQITYANG